MARTKTTATLLFDNVTPHGHRYVLRLSRRVRYGDNAHTDHVVVSEATVLGEPETVIFPSYYDGRIFDMAGLRGSFKGAMDWRKAVRRAGWALTAGTGGGKSRHPMPPHGRRRTPRKKPLKPQSVKRRWREYDAHVRESGRMAGLASRPVTGETAKLLLQLGAALKR